jgi:hypothetical protein
MLIQKKITYLIACYVTYTFFISCNQSPSSKKENNVATKKEQKKFVWTEGTFKSTSKSGVYTELWLKVNDTEYFGNGYFIATVDTLFSMKMKLIVEKQAVKIFYTVRGQNNGQATEFVLSKQQNNVYTFENPFRSFPSIMQYKLLSDTAITVLERGFVDNKEKVREYTVIKN